MSHDDEKKFVSPSLYKEDLVHLCRNNFRLDEFVKKFIVRYFRQILKNTFTWYFQKKRHYSCKKTMWKSLEDFYTGAIWEGREDVEDMRSKGAVILNIPNRVFKQHKDIFASLLFSTKNLHEKLGIK